MGGFGKIVSHVGQVDNDMLKILWEQKKHPRTESFHDVFDFQRAKSVGAKTSKNRCLSRLDGMMGFVILKINRLFLW